MAERTTTEEAKQVCPVVDIDYRTNPRPAFWHYESLNEVREMATITWNETPNGYWMVNRYDEVREALQRNDIFTNDVVSALGDPDPANHPRLLPQNLNGQEHVWYRHVVNPWFSPGSIERVMPFARQRCIDLIEAIKDKG